MSDALVAGAGNPEGQKLLTDSISYLRHKHVEFAHEAQHDLLHVGCARLHIPPVLAAVPELQAVTSVTMLVTRQEHLQICVMYIFLEVLWHSKCAD